MHSHAGRTVASPLLRTIYLFTFILTQSSTTLLPHSEPWLKTEHKNESLNSLEWASSLSVWRWVLSVNAKHTHTHTHARLNAFLQQCIDTLACRSCTHKQEVRLTVLHSLRGASIGSCRWTPECDLGPWSLRYTAHPAGHGNKYKTQQTHFKFKDADKKVKADCGDEWEAAQREWETVDANSPQYLILINNINTLRIDVHLLRVSLLVRILITLCLYSVAGRQVS